MLLPLLQNNLLAAAAGNSLNATETGEDTFAGSGQVVVKGTLAGSESGADTAAAIGQIIVKGAVAALETGADTFAAVGSAISATATGTLNALEVGADTCAMTNVSISVSGAHVGTRAEIEMTRLARYGITSRPEQDFGTRRNAAGTNRPNRSARTTR
jgi:hypothetical protein